MVTGKKLAAHSPGELFLDVVADWCGMLGMTVESVNDRRPVFPKSPHLGAKVGACWS